MKQLTELARKLRKNSTDAEHCLWQSLRNRQLLNHKFRRQYVIGNYIVDFICLDKKLIIELDGSQHMDNEIYDQKRTEYIEKHGFRVIRFCNDEVLIEIDAVLECVVQNINHPQPSPLPEGEGAKDQSRG